jgi:hypothetical protein
LQYAAAGWLPQRRVHAHHPAGVQSVRCRAVGPIAGNLARGRADRGVVQSVDDDDHHPLDLNANNPGDGGSVLVYIVPNQNVTGLPTLPSHTGTGNTFHFTGAPIATILDSALTACGANENCTGTGQNFGQINLNVSDTLPAGEYWLGLENVPGGGNSTATAKLVKLTPALSGGIGNAGQLDFNQNAIVGPGSPNTYSAADGGPLVYGVMIATPEPASLAILGAAMAGLGVMRRHRRS